MRNVRRKQPRSRQGSMLSELGPALFILLIFALFPAVDLTLVGLGYSSLHTLNDLQLREAAKVPRSQAISVNGAVMQGIPQKWNRSALGMVAGSPQNVQTDVNYKPGVGTIYVQITTSASIKPLLVIPFFPNVPGLSAPVNFKVSGSRPLESLAFAAQ